MPHPYPGPRTADTRPVFGARVTAAGRGVAAMNVLTLGDTGSPPAGSISKPCPEGVVLKREGAACNH